MAEKETERPIDRELVKHRENVGDTYTEIERGRERQEVGGAEKERDRQREK